MIQGYTEKFIEKAKGKKCDLCDQGITAKEAESKEFHYSKTKRRTEIFIHKKCWDRMMHNAT